jgi:alpha-L-arabinofuranosidase
MKSRARNPKAALKPPHSRRWHDCSGSKISRSLWSAAVLAPLWALTNVASLSQTRAAESARVTVQADKPGIAVPTTLHGLFFEDINYGADGGLYAELIQNRSFEHRQPLFAWSEEADADAKARILVETESPLNANNTHFLRIYVTESGKNGFAVSNPGFDGIVLRSGEKYLFSVYARLRAGDARQLQVSLEDKSGRILTTQYFGELGATWKKFEATLTSPANETDAKLLVHVLNRGVVDLDMISLFPEKTFKGRRNGLRADLAQALADVKPGFLRFPGGCIVEGRDFANMYRWKDTIGDVAERKQNWNVWQDGRSPQYYQTYGLGFFEYFQLCEDIGAEPVPVINCGMCCQARRGPPVPLDELGPYVQDALDLIEFANGPATSKWGARRAAMGHPKPFNLKFLAVGNEQWQQVYFDRYDVFYRALKAKYPEIKLISSAGPLPNDPLWEFAWNKFRNGTPADVVDEHYYVPPQWLMENGDRYDRYDRKGPKIFVGEFAAHDGRLRKNNLRAALAEAAYMTSLWKNSDVVLMASYAPLFGKYGHDQWHPNLIWFDNSRAVLTPSYFAQAQFARNRPDVVLPVRVEAGTINEKSSGMIGVGTWNTQAEYKDVRVTAPDGKVLFESDFTKGLNGWKTADGQWAAVDGALRQSAGGENIRAVAGDPSWTDYTLTLKARKLGGEEGFLVLFRTADIDNTTWWNLGGWRNTEHSLQGEGMTERHVQGSIETNRWYDVRVELRGGSVKAYLDGKLIHEADRKPVSLLYASAGRDDRAHEIILQLVNPFAQPMAAAIKLAGLRTVGSRAQVMTLANADPDTENTLNRPDAVAPRTGEFTGVAPEFTYHLEPHSLTTLRIPEK